MSAKAKELFREAQFQFVEEDFVQAIDLYSQAIEHDPQPNYYLNRAVCYIKMEKYLDALPDCTKCLELDPKHHKGWFRKGIAFFHLDEYEPSNACFEKAQETGSKSCKTWLRKCQAELKREENLTGFEPPESNAEPPPPKKKKLVKFDWCQTDDLVTITLYVKKLKRKDTSIKCEEKKVHVTLNLPNGSVWIKDWHLFEFVDQKKFKSTVSPYKVELILHKLNPREQWDSLEDAEHHIPGPGAKNKGPYSGKKTVQEWEELEQEAKKEDDLKPGDGWQKLFAHIYAKNDDATKRAMNKSYSESGGTVLSANWDDVQGKDYTKDVEGPDGTEVRKYADMEN